MNERTLVQFWMESSDQLIALSRCYDMSVDYREDLYPIANRLNVWSADKSHGDLSQRLHLSHGVETT